MSTFWNWSSAFTVRLSGFPAVTELALRIANPAICPETKVTATGPSVTVLGPEATVAVTNFVSALVEVSVAGVAGN